MYKIIILTFLLKNFLPFSGDKKHGFKTGSHGYTIKKVAQLPDSVREGSGLEIAEEGKSFWTFGDSGNKSQLFEFNEQGEVLSVHLFQLKNKDWEDITKDEQGNIYIGDFGNNRSNRKNLVIYKVSSSFDSIQTIRFEYEDQNEFPKEANKLNFDCESVIYYKDSLYLFSKNRGDNWVKVYSLPAVAGNYKARVVQKIYINTMITGADISPDGKLVALCSYGRIYFLHVDTTANHLKLTPYFRKRFNRSLQSEGIVFTNDTDLLISNEQGQLFKARKKK